MELHDWVRTSTVEMDRLYEVWPLAMSNKRSKIEPCMTRCRIDAMQD